MSLTKKQRIIRGLTLAKALYGAEASGVRDTDLNQLRTHVANAIGSSSRRRSVDITFETDPAVDIDPWGKLLLRRVLLLRCSVTRAMKARRRLFWRTPAQPP